MKQKSLCEEEDEGRDVFLSDSKGDKDYVKENEDVRDSGLDYPDIDESDSDDQTKQPHQKSRKLVMDGRQKKKKTWWNKDTPRKSHAIGSHTTS